MSRQGDAEPLLRLDDRKALVTGAGSGIGAAAACALARAGAEVVLLGRTRSRLEQVAAEIVASGGRALPLVCDVTHTAAMREAIGGLDSLDILLNNAGVNIPERFVDVSVTLRTLTPLGREQTPDDIGNTVAFSVLGSGRRYYRASHGGGRRNRAIPGRVGETSMNEGRYRTSRSPSAQVQRRTVPRRYRPTCARARIRQPERA